jgi:hypothetical protein
VSSTSEPPPPGGVGGASLTLSVLAILLIITRIGLLLIPAVALSVWAILLSWRQLSSADRSGKVLAIVGLVLGALVVSFALFVLVLLPQLGL